MAVGKEYLESIMEKLEPSGEENPSLLKGGFRQFFQI